MPSPEQREKNRERVNRWRAANRERVREQSARRWRDDPAYRERAKDRRKKPSYRAAEHARQRAERADPAKWPMVVLRDIRRRCKADGIPFDLSPTDIVVPDVCPIRLTPFVFGAVGHPDSPSVDRINPKGGYVRGNVAVISRSANTMKSDCTDPDAFLRLATYLAQAQGFVEAVIEVRRGAESLAA
jgi:hypothetical protein